MMQVLRQGCPGNIGQGCVALLPGLEVPWVNRAIQFRQCIFRVPLNELGAGGSGAVGGSLEHWIEPLWVSVL